MIYIYTAGLGICLGLLLNYAAWHAERNTDNWTILSVLLVFGLGGLGYLVNLVTALQTGKNRSLAIFLLAVYVTEVSASCFNG